MVLANKPTPNVPRQKSGFNKALLRETHGEQAADSRKLLLHVITRPCGNGSKITCNRFCPPSPQKNQQKRSVANFVVYWYYNYHQIETP